MYRCIALLMGCTAVPACKTADCVVWPWRLWRCAEVRLSKVMRRLVPADQVVVKILCLVSMQ